MSRVGWGSRRKNIWEDLRQEGIGRFKVTEQRRQEGWHEQCQGPDLEDTSLSREPQGYSPNLCSEGAEPTLPGTVLRVSLPRHT